jgi:hypothetical protein
MSEIVQTTFNEWRGVYERHKAEALARHCRDLAEIVDRAATVEIDPERNLKLEEWLSDEAEVSPRRGRWITELEVSYLT